MTFQHRARGARALRRRDNPGRELTLPELTNLARSLLQHAIANVLQLKHAPQRPIADCRATEYRASAEGYEALIDGAWLRVPQDKVLHRVANPIGRAVVCYMPGRGILCFVTPDEA